MFRRLNRSPAINQALHLVRTGLYILTIVHVSLQCKGLLGRCVSYILRTFVMNNTDGNEFAGGLSIILMFGMLLHLVEFKARKNVSMYKV